jgi:hypothetical protein
VFIETLHELVLDNNRDLLSENDILFERIPFNQWINKIVEIQSVSHLNDASSVQRSLNLFMASYGSLTSTFAKDLLKAKNKAFASMIYEVSLKPNNLQFAIA